MNRYSLKEFQLGFNFPYTKMTINQGAPLHIFMMICFNIYNTYSTEQAIGGHERQFKKFEKHVKIFVTLTLLPKSIKEVLSITC